MQLTHIFTILWIFGLILTTVLSDSTSLDMDDNNGISKRLIFGHKRRDDEDPSPRRQCVRCRLGVIRCCYPNVCVRRHLRMDKCLRVKT